MANELSKVGRFKIYLERRHHEFPTTLDLGMLNDTGSPYKSRMLIKHAERSLNLKKLDEAYESLLKVFLVCSLEPVENPLIEIVSIRNYEIISICNHAGLDGKRHSQRIEDHVPEEWHDCQEHGHRLR